MANTISWQWDALDRDYGPDDDGHENVVTTVHYHHVSEDGEGHSSRLTKSTQLTRGDDDEWIEFEDITEADLIAWVEGALGEESVEQLIEWHDANIEASVNPVRDTVHTMPWIED